MYAYRDKAGQLVGGSCRICGKYAIPGTNVQVWQTISKRASYKNLIHCSSVWVCPICAMKIRGDRKTEIMTVLKGAQSAGYNMIFLTLTKKHSFSLSDVVVKKTLKSVNENFTKILRTKHLTRIKKAFDLNYVKLLETTFGKDNGFHPHLHLVLFFKSSNNQDVKTIYEQISKVVINAWLAYHPGTTQRNQVAKFVYNKDVKGFESALAEYVTKMDLSFELTNPVNAKEQKKKGLNPLSIPQMLVDEQFNDYDPDELAGIFQIYAKAVKGSNFRTYSKVKNASGKMESFAKQFLSQEEKTDAEICADTSELQYMLLNISPNLWKVIINNNLRAEILNMVERWIHTGKGISDELKALFKAVGYNVEWDKDNIIHITI